MKKLFISYAHADKKIVLPIVRELQDLGFEAWIDSRGLTGGSIWEEEIKNGIFNCDTVLFFMSLHSLKSRYVRKELRLALESSKHIVPLKLEEADIPRSLKHSLSSIQWIEYSEKDWKSKLLVALGSDQGNQLEQKRRLEGAMPQATQVNTPMELRGMISLLGSKGLRKYLPENVSVDNITRQDVKESDFPLRFPADSSTGKLLDLQLFVAVNPFTSGLQVDPPFRKIVVPPGMDSGVFSFILTPSKVVEHAIAALELFQDEERTALIGSLTVTTKVKSLQSEMGEAVWNLSTWPLNIAIVLSRHARVDDRSLLLNFKDVSERLWSQFHFLFKNVGIMLSAFYKKQTLEINDVEDITKLTARVYQQLAEVLETESEFNKNLEVIKLIPNIRDSEKESIIETKVQTKKDLYEFLRLLRDEVNDRNWTGALLSDDMQQRDLATDRLRNTMKYYQEALSTTFRNLKKEADAAIEVHGGWPM